ncbi:MAG: membrane protein insertase YidC [Clostridiales bacterium]|nr:membrane protein insertase YidC [Clostridiales bacterium]
MEVIYTALGWIMTECYYLCRNYGAAIILFTLISKIFLLPISVWVHKNSIKMIKMQPDINFIKVNSFGDKDAIAEEQSKLYKKEKYSPFASMIPLAIQIVILMGLVHVIKSGMNDSSIDMYFFGINLSLVPSEWKGWFIFSPVMAALSSIALCVAQNDHNVLQSEQSKWNQYGTMLLSAGLSLYLGWFVPVGVALYWIASNLMAILQLSIMNRAIPPGKYIDYERLAESKKALKELENIGKGPGKKLSTAEKKKERTDYKRFFKVVNKHIVFYSEERGFYKYFKGLIEYLLEHTNLTIHYITSDAQDPVFDIAAQNERFKAYFIAEKRLITLMMKMDADMVLMTMPDLENFHIKRSYVRKDIEYVYIPHGMDSHNLMMRKGAIDHYDTVFCVGQHQIDEIRQTERVYGLPEKKVVKSGYSLLDEMLADYQKTQWHKKEQETILIAPSWQKDNIVDSCLEQILENLKELDKKIVVRPHPQHIRHNKEYIESLKQKYKNNDNIYIQTDFSSNSTVFSADLMITDWSGIAYEYAYTTKRPVLFINTPMKVMNPEYQRIETVPLNILLRDEIGKTLNLDELDHIADEIKDLLDKEEFYRVKIEQFVEKYVFNLGHSAEIGGKYIIEEIQKKVNERRKNK